VIPAVGLGFADSKFSGGVAGFWGIRPRPHQSSAPGLHWDLEMGTELHGGLGPP